MVMERDEEQVCRLRKGRVYPQALGTGRVRALDMGGRLRMALGVEPGRLRRGELALGTELKPVERDG